MVKSLKRFKKYKKSQRKTRKIKKRNSKGGNGEKVTCSMCEKIIDKNDTLVPRECMMKYGRKAAHRICKDCWWNPESGFAREDALHKCPGCIKGLPLTEKPITFIDLTEE